MGGMGGMDQGGQNMQQMMSQMMNNPLMQQMMNDPEVMRTIFQANPQIRQV